MKKTTPKKFCFVLMPFDEAFDDIYKLGIKQSCIDAESYCERVDEQIFDEQITDRIYNQISKADIVIAEMSGRNPNVFYEVGYAHALGKITILLTKNSKDIPFDLKQYPHIIYNNRITTLKEELTKKIKWFIENDKTDDIDYKINIDIYLDSNNLSDKKVTYYTPIGNVPHPRLLIHNKTFKTYLPEDYQIGIITDDNYPYSNNREVRTIKMPDGKILHMLPFSDEILYPNSYTYINFTLRCDDKYMNQQEIIVRLFTSVGNRDYSLIIDFDKTQKEIPL